MLEKSHFSAQGPCRGLVAVTGVGWGLPEHPPEQGEPGWGGALSSQGLAAISPCRDPLWWSSVAGPLWPLPCASPAAGTAVSRMGALPAEGLSLRGLSFVPRVL